MNLENYTLEQIFQKYSVDLRSLGLNPFQEILYQEFTTGNITEENINKSVIDLETSIAEEEDPKKAKELLKRKNLLSNLIVREKKPINLELEEKWQEYFGEVDKIILDLDPEYRSKLISNVLINENPKWHPERNSLVHIKIVTSRGLEYGDEDLIRCGIFHDIAKFDTVSFNAKGWPTSLGHDRKGYESARISGENEIVQWVCLNHMKIKGWKSQTESDVLTPQTRREIFDSAPGDSPEQKAKSFWKLCVFSKMDDMAYDFRAANLKWPNPGFLNWNDECPLREDFNSEEFTQDNIKQQPKKPETPYVGQDLIKFGAKGPQIGNILSQIAGKTKEEAQEIIKNVLGNQDVVFERKRWIKSIAQWKNKIQN